VGARALRRLPVRACSLAYPANNEYALYSDVICGPSGCTKFSALSHKLHDFRKKELLNIKLIFRKTLSKTFLILRRIQRDIVTNVKMSSCKE
jgi:hypothetical protein